MTKKLYSFFLLFFILWLTQCNYQTDSYGDFENIIVFADSGLYQTVKPALEETFDNFIYTPHSERSFYLNVQPLQLLSGYKMRRNLLFVGLLEGDDPVSKYLDDMLSQEVKDAVRAGRLFQIFKQNLFATEQMGMILVASDAQTLRKKIEESGRDIYTQLEDYYFARLERLMFLRGEQTAMEDFFAENFGWKIRIQHDYSLVKESENGDFVWLRRFRPDRNIVIYRFKTTKLYDDTDFITALRDSLMTVHFEGDSVSVEDSYLLFTKFNGVDAVKLVGIWQNHKLRIGGPFRTYLFYRQEQKYAYLIDIHVTAPGKRKKPYLDQLEVMAKSFQITTSPI